MTEGAVEKRMRLRFAGRCRLCDIAIEARTEAFYERGTKTVRCLACVPTPQTHGADPRTALDVDPIASDTTEVGSVTESLDSGTAGASARREYERRQAKREERIRTSHPRLGGLILALSDDPQSTTAWNTGALGEERLGQKLDDVACDTVRMLHDRRIPGSRANIDHLAVTSAGVFVIDAKRYVGKRPALVVEGGILRPRVERLMVGSRDQSKLVDGVIKQVDLVTRLVGADLPVYGILCFVEADWPLIGGSFTTRGVEVLRPKKLYPRLSAEGPHAPKVGDLHTTLARALPPA